MKISNNIQIGKKRIGDGKKIYIMGDIGLTNGGDIERTFKLIDFLKKLGVDAVKMQMLGPNELLGDKKVKYTYPTLNNGLISQNMFQMFSELNYSNEEWFKISKYCFSKKLEFICTSHFIGAVSILEKCEVNIHKICTWSLNHRRLIEEIGKTKKPLMIDTGASTLKEIKKLFSWHANKGGKGKLILHDFHTENIHEMNFNNIKTFKENFNCPVGYTPQGRNYEFDLMSIGLGVNILEKRLTVDRSIPKNGHWKSLEPTEFKQWIKKIRDCESALGSFKVKPTTEDLKISKWAFKSLYTNQNVKKGEIAKDEMFSAKRPGDGISPSEINKIIGKKFKKNVLKGSICKREMFEN